MLGLGENCHFSLFALILFFCFLAVLYVTLGNVVSWFYYYLIWAVFFCTVLNMNVWHCRFDIVLQVSITSWCFIAGPITAADRWEKQRQTRFHCRSHCLSRWTWGPWRSEAISVLSVHSLMSSESSAWDWGLESLGYRNTDKQSHTIVVEFTQRNMSNRLCFRSSATKPSELPHCMPP